MELSNSSNSGENYPTYECKEVDPDNDQPKVKEEVAIRETVKATRKRNKPSLHSKGDGAALVLVKPTSSGNDLQIIQEELSLKFKKGGSEKTIYQKAFITRMTTRSFSSVVAQLNEV